MERSVKFEILPRQMNWYGEWKTTINWTVRCFYAMSFAATKAIFFCFKFTFLRSFLRNCADDEGMLATCRKMHLIVNFRWYNRNSSISERYNSKRPTDSHSCFLYRCQQWFVGQISLLECATGGYRHCREFSWGCWEMDIHRFGHSLGGNAEFSSYGFELSLSNCVKHISNESVLINEKWCWATFELKFRERSHSFMA